MADVCGGRTAIRSKAHRVPAARPAGADVLSFEVLNYEISHALSMLDVGCMHGAHGRSRNQKERTRPTIATNVRSR